MVVFAEGDLVTEQMIGEVCFHHAKVSLPTLSDPQESCPAGGLVANGIPSTVFDRNAARVEE
jgi:hypothetical protein